MESAYHQRQMSTALSMFTKQEPAEFSALIGKSIKVA